MHVRQFTILPCIAEIVTTFRQESEEHRRSKSLDGGNPCDLLEGHHGEKV